MRSRRTEVVKILMPLYFFPLLTFSQDSLYICHILFNFQESKKSSVGKEWKFLRKSSSVISWGSVLGSYYAHEEFVRVSVWGVTASAASAASAASGLRSVREGQGRPRPATAHALRTGLIGRPEDATMRGSNKGDRGIGEDKMNSHGGRQDRCKPFRTYWYTSHGT